MTGVVVLVVALVAATAFGLWWRRTSGRVVDTRALAPVGSDRSTSCWATQSGASTITRVRRPGCVSGNKNGWPLLV